MAKVTIRKAGSVPGVDEAVAAHTAAIKAALPGAWVDHVGATSIPGALTKGDVDLRVRVFSHSRPGMTEAVRVLAERYRVHQRENWTPTYASFVDPDSSAPPVGIQLTVTGSYESRMFETFAVALSFNEDLLNAYNALKRGLEGASYERYTAAKGAFIEQVLGARRSSIWPMLRYEDASAAMNFLMDAFGLEQSAVIFGADREVTHCELSLQGGGTLAIGSATYLGGVHGEVGRGPITCYLVTDDVDSLHETAVSAGADVVQPPAEIDLGTGVPMRAFTARDPEGNLWMVGTHRGA